MSQGEGDIAWTNHGTGNVNTAQVSAIISGSLVITKTLQFGEYIGQHNNGNHTALYGDVQAELAGTDLVVPTVDAAGGFQGWATFHVVSAAGGSSKTITGYFKSNVTNPKLSVTACPTGNCPRYVGRTSSSSSISRRTPAAIGLTPSVRDLIQRARVRSVRLDGLA